MKTPLSTAARAEVVSRPDVPEAGSTVQQIQSTGASVHALRPSGSGTQAIDRTRAAAVSALIYEGYDAGSQRLQETLCTFGNGYFATRGILWPGTEINLGEYKKSYPATYLAGVYDAATTQIGGKDVNNDDMVNCPNWQTLQFRVGGSKEWIDPHDASRFEILESKQSLEMKTGLLKTRLLVQDREGRKTLFEMERFADMRDPHQARLRATVTPINWSGEIAVRSGLDGRVENKGVERYGELTSKHFDRLRETASKDGVLGLSVVTKQSKIEVAEAERLRVFSGAEELRPKLRADKAAMAVFQEASVAAEAGRPITFDKVASIYTSRDPGVADPKRSAAASVEGAASFDAAKARHAEIWADRWTKARTRVDGAGLEFVQKVLDLHTYHLLATATPHNASVDAGLPARGLSGESYRGHIFWDTCLITRFLDHHTPEVSRPLLDYRVRRLDKALENARIDGGYEGAMYPWQSGLDGSETTQTVAYNPNSKTWGPDESRRQRHISFDIFYDAYNYFVRTKDKAFLVEGGAEMMLQIARFGASLAKEESDGRFHIEGVMGPDEFHEHFPGSDRPGLRDNAYTNLMVAWTLAKIPEVLSALPRKARAEVMQRAGVSSADLDRYAAIAERMHVEVDEQGIIEQFAGYFGLKEVDLEAYKKKHGNIYRMDRILKAEGDSPDRYKVAKQADALMIFYMLPFEEVKALFARLGHEIDRDALARNYDYYVDRTSHGSTLSKIVHCHLAHLLGREEEALAWYGDVLKSDIADVQGGTTPEGIHMGVMAGSLDFVTRALVGLEAGPDGVIRLDPKLPKGWDQVMVPPFQFQGRTVRVSARRDEVEVRIDGLSAGEKQPVEVFGKARMLEGGRTHRFSRDSKTGGGRMVAVRAATAVLVEAEKAPAVRVQAIMSGTVSVRRRAVEAILAGEKVADKDVRALRDALRSLEAVGRRGGVDVSYEVAELEKDLIFLTEGEGALLQHLGRLHASFDEEVARGVAMLGGSKYRTFVTDRDGTINNYCARYGTSVQSIYNAVFLARFFGAGADQGLILTAAPLGKGGGLLDVSTLPEGTVAFAGSSGREWRTKAGASFESALPSGEARVLAAFNRGLEALLDKPENRIFSSIGSGLQKKVGETVIARQDIARSIPVEASERFAAAVRALAAKVDPKGQVLSVSAGGNDVEVKLKGGADGRAYDKGTGLAAVDQQMGLELANGRNLVAGDTKSDVAMLKAALAANPNTEAAFITRDEALAREVKALCPNAFITGEPDVFVAVLGALTP